MKIKQEHRKAIITACRNSLCRNSTSIQQVINHYQKNGIGKDPARRAKWDVFRTAKMQDGEKLYQWVCREVYPYANDDHIESVLNRV